MREFELLVLLNKSNEKNIDFINTLKADENGEVKLSFEDLKLKFQQLGEKITSLNNQIEFTQNLEEREAWSVLKELDKMDENFNKYKVNYSLALFSITNYRFIMEKYGMGSLNEIFVRFKKILKDSCTELDELWMIDEKSYLIVSPGKSKEEITELVNTNIDIWLTLLIKINDMNFRGYNILLINKSKIFYSFNICIVKLSG